MSIAEHTRAVLLVLRLRGGLHAADLETALASVGVHVESANVFLGRLELAGLVGRRASTDRWVLTDDGRAEGERLLAAELDASMARDEVNALYAAFLSLNGPLLRACTDWQLRDADPNTPVLNDHTDAAFDQGVLRRLADIQRSIDEPLRAAGEKLVRYDAYAGRLAAAHDRTGAGQFDAIDQGLDSYHGTWFELHEDLVATLGRDRATEPLPDTSR